MGMSVAWGPLGHQGLVQLRLWQQGQGHSYCGGGGAGAAPRAGAAAVGEFPKQLPIAFF